jgi:ribosomal protein L10
MSKQVKQFELASLRKRFEGVRDLVILSATKVDSIQTSTMRSTLRKKSIRLHMTKNSFARKILGENGITVGADAWKGTTYVAFGTENIKDLSNAVDGVITDLEKDVKNKNKIKVKTAVADGIEVTFEAAKKMPTRQEAIGEIIGAILYPYMAIASQLVGPISQVASQIAQIGEGKLEEAVAETPAAS